MNQPFLSYFPFAATILFCFCISRPNNVTAQEAYQLGPNSWRYEKIPVGTITHHTWESKIFPSTTRDYPDQFHKGTNNASILRFNGSEM